jgi:tetratricopeptide (TPR) repeat protein
MSPRHSPPIEFSSGLIAGRLGRLLAWPLAWLLVCASAVQAPAQGTAGGRLFRLEATLPAEAGGVEAVAINADESILAQAVTRDGVTRIALFDRPSRTKLGTIAATVGGNPRLRFAPDQDLLLVAGSRAVQLWDVPVAPLKPDALLPENHRRWEQSLDKPALQARFADPADYVYWISGGALFRRGIAPASPPAAQAAWPAAGAPERTVTSFRFGHGGSGIIVTYAGEKDPDVLDALRMTRRGTLSGHRFVVQAGTQTQGRAWLSVDQGNSIVRWSETLLAQQTVHLEGLPAGFGAADLAPLGARHVLLAGSVGGGGLRALAFNPATWRAEDEVSAADVEQVAVSPTGRYLLAADGRATRLYGFALPESPQEYVRRLRVMGARKVAQTYVRLLDENGLPPRTKAGLAAELNRVAPGAPLREALARLGEARKAGNAAEVRHWAEEAQRLQPNHPDAVQALQDLKTAQERAVLEKARAALEAGQPAAAISLLVSQVPADSALHDEAQSLIRLAEGRRKLEITLSQARDQMNLGDYPAAAALANEALRQDGENPAAHSLLAEIQGRAGGTGSRDRWALGLGAGLAAAIMALVWRQVRARPARRPAAVPPPLKVGARRKDPPPTPSPRRVPVGGQVDAEPSARPGGSGAERRSPARMQAIETALTGAEDLLRLARHADVAREHTAYLMGLEAELAALRRSLANPGRELGSLHERVKAIAVELRGLKFSPPRPEPADEAAAAPPHQEPNFYELLQVPVTASGAEIKVAYHRLLKQYHPDLHNASSFGWVKDEAERMSKLLGRAYDVLSDATMRTAYDRELARGRAPSAAPRTNRGATR